MVVASKFSDDVQAIVGPLLTGQGFVLDSIDDRLDAGGRAQHVVYYRARDCKLQVYQSSRDGEVNCMIAPLAAPNAYGQCAPKWQMISRWTARPDLPFAEALKAARAEYRSYPNPLDWVRHRIAQNLEAARAGITEMYGGTS